MLATSQTETPRPGDIIRYRYLWVKEAQDGYDAKTPRSCMVLHAQPVGDRHECLVVPISDQPSADCKFLAIPDAARQIAKIDDYNRYIVVSEANVFLWPSWDVIPVKSREVDELIRGTMPHGFFSVIKEATEKLEIARNEKIVDREKLAQRDIDNYRKRRDARAYGR